MKKTLLSIALSSLLFGSGIEELQELSTNLVPVEKVKPSYEANKSYLNNQSSTDFNIDFYLGAGAGYYSFDNDLSNENINSFSGTLIAGVNLNKYIGGEFRYSMNLGDMDYDKGNTLNPDYETFPSNLSSMSYLVKLRLDIDDFTPYVLLGYGTLDLSDMPPESGKADKSDATFQYGAGVSYGVTDNLSVFGDYLSLYRDDGYDDVAGAAYISSGLFTLGLTYTF